MNLEFQPKAPKTFWNSFRLVGGFSCFAISTMAVLGETPVLLIIYPRYLQELLNFLFYQIRL